MEKRGGDNGDNSNCKGFSDFLAFRGWLYPRHPRTRGIKKMGRREIRDVYTLMMYKEEVERIQDGRRLPLKWYMHRMWLGRMPISKLKGRMNRGEGMYYVPRFGYVRNGDVYEVDERCVGAICMVVILVNGGIAISKVSEVTGLSQSRVRNILRNYKYYVGWHNAYTMDGRRIWPEIKEVVLLQKDVIEGDIGFAKDVIECQFLDK